MSDVYKLRSFEALICCKAARSNWKQLQHKINVGEIRDVIEFFLNFLALGKSANLSFAYPVVTCRVGVYSSVT